MSFRIEQPLYLAHLRGVRAPGKRAEGLPALTREGGRWQAKRFASRSIRRNRLLRAKEPGSRRAAELSNLVSLNHNIVWVMTLATPIWGRKGRLAARLAFGSAFLYALMLCTSFWNASAASAQTDETERVREAFRQKQNQCREKPEDSKAGWQFGQACFDLADLATNKAERAQIAQLGIDACRKSVAADSNSAPAHYYLSLNLGQLARTRTLGALKLVSQMERELSRAIELDSHFDYGGAERSLGLLYRDAPTLGSIGSRSKARQHLQKAVELAPSYPDNRLSLIESYLKWGEREPARRELKALKESWPRARLEFSEPVWKQSWQEWEERLRKIEKKLEDGSRMGEATSSKD